MEIDEIVFARLRDSFTNEWKRIEVYNRRPLTKNANLREEYKTNIILRFNDICKFLQQIYVTNSLEKKLECVARINPYIEKCKKAFQLLLLKYEWPESELSEIDINSVTSNDQTIAASVTSDIQSGDGDSETGNVNSQNDKPSGSTSVPSEVASTTADSDLFFDSENPNDSRIDQLIHDLSLSDIRENTLRAHSSQNENSIIQSESSDGEQIPPTVHIAQVHALQSEGEQGETQTFTMVGQTVEEFIKLVSPMLNYKYEGDPLKLESFIEDVELVESLATSDASKGVLVKFLKTKIAGKARECLPEVVATVNDIKNALKNGIKPDNSLVIEGRLTALRVYKNNYTKFSEDAEKLADAFRRSLIGEGFTKEKANQLTLTKTKEICRRVAKNDLVRGIIASTSFDSPAEVIAKLVTETDIAQKEKKDNDTFQKRGQQNNKNNKRNTKFDKNNKNEKNNGKFRGKSNKNKSNENQGAKRGNQNSHTIRIVTDAGSSTAAAENTQNNSEQVFRLAQS